MSLRLIKVVAKEVPPNERIVARLEHLLALAKTGALHDLSTVHYEDGEFHQWSESEEALSMGALLHDLAHTLISTREGNFE